tara:strand:+ start:650 stop:832 length:183 start_codon:yes stop_codon:yes gene_type:complete
MLEAVAVQKDFLVLVVLEQVELEAAVQVVKPLQELQELLTLVVVVEAAVELVVVVLVDQE